jgi:heat shock protein HslJ
MLTRAALLTSTVFASLAMSNACFVNAASADETSAAAFASAPKLAVSKTELINVGGWKLESAQRADGAVIEALTAADAEVKIAFEMDGIRADAGCNKLAGTYRAGSGKITTDLAITTRMSCDDAKNRADAALSELFKQTFKAELRQTEPMRIRLTGENGDVLMFVAMPLSF